MGFTARGGSSPPFGSDSWAGETYLIYGRSKPGALSGVFDLANADVIFDGIDEGDHCGRWVCSEGDVNGDGIDDLLIGAYYADPNSVVNAGETYLIYGRSGPGELSGVFDLASADVIFEGIDRGDYSGVSASSAGDVNGDAIDDLLIAAFYANPNGDVLAGETYLVYGCSGPEALSGVFDLASADAIFEGIDPQDRSGFSVSSAGDVNGDGLGDLLIGAREADPNGDSGAGETYLVYGRSGSPDLDSDGDVDLDDYELLEAAMKGPAQTSGDPDADLDFDGDCDLDDYAVFAANFTGPL